MTILLGARKTELAATIKTLQYLPKTQRSYLLHMNAVCKSEKEFIAIRMLVGIIEKFHELQNRHGAMEILKGAHIIIKDCAVLYDLAKKKLDVRHRVTSHYSWSKKIENGIAFHDIGVNIPGKADIVAGTNKDNLIWFQMERHKVDFSGVVNGIWLFIMHMIDYLQYKITGQNVGPCGRSNYTETNPLELPKQVINDLLLEFAKKDEELSGVTQQEKRTILGKHTEKTTIVLKQPVISCK